MKLVRHQSFERIHRIEDKQDLSIRRRQGEVEGLRIRESIAKGYRRLQDPITQDLINSVKSPEAHKENLFNSIYINNLIPIRIIDTSNTIPTPSV